MKRNIALALAAVLSMTALFTGCSTSEEPAQTTTAETTEEETSTEGEETSTDTVEGEWKAAMCTDLGGVEDRSFNESVWTGLQTAESELGFQVEYLQSITEADYATNLDTLLENGNQLIIGVGFALAEATAAAAQENPDTYYACVDNEYTDFGGADNLMGIIFKEEQGGFLAGYVAGLTTETNKIGFIGGMEFPSVQRYQYGFEYGAKMANPDVEVIVEYCNSFTDVAMGKSKAQKLYQEDGCDITFAAAGSCGIGSIEAAKELDKMIIGCDVDQNYMAPENVIASPLKRCDLAVLEACQEVQEGTFEGGTNFIGSIENDMVGIAYSDLISEETKTATDAVAEQVKSGEIVVPNTAEALTEALNALNA